MLVHEKNVYVNIFLIFAIVVVDNWLLFGRGHLRPWVSRGVSGKADFFVQLFSFGQLRNLRDHDALRKAAQDGAETLFLTLHFTESIESDFLLSHEVDGDHHCDAERQNSEGCEESVGYLVNFN